MHRSERNKWIGIHMVDKFHPVRYWSSGPTVNDELSKVFTKLHCMEQRSQHSSGLNVNQSPQVSHYGTYALYNMIFTTYFLCAAPLTNSVLETEPHLYELENEISSKIPAKWKAVGIQLGLTANKLDQISTEESNDCQNCFRRVFIEWKSQNCEKSWSALLRILQTDAVGEGRFAEEVRKNLQW